MSLALDPAERPEPIRDALAKVAYGLGSLVALVVGFGSFFGLTATQTAEISTYTDQVNQALPLLASPLMAIFSGAVAILGILRAGRHATGEATPVADPRDRDGTPLMRVDGKPLGGVEPSPIYAPTPID